MAQTRVIDVEKKGFRAVSNSLFLCIANEDTWKSNAHPRTPSTSNKTNCVNIPSTETCSSRIFNMQESSHVHLVTVFSPHHATPTTNPTSFATRARINTPGARNPTHRPGHPSSSSLRINAEQSTRFGFQTESFRSATCIAARGESSAGTLSEPRGLFTFMRKHILSGTRFGEYFKQGY